MRKSKRLMKKLSMAGLVAAAVVGGFSLPLVTSSVASQEVHAATDVVINATNFPDANFKEYVMLEVDSNSDGVLSKSEIKNCKRIDCRAKGVLQLKGIEFFGELEELWCGNNNISRLDISKNVKLKDLSCSCNNIRDLNLKNNLELTQLACDNNMLERLDLSKNTALEILFCFDNKLGSIDLSKNTSLWYVDVGKQSKEIKTTNKEVKLNDIDPLLNQTNISYVKNAVLSGNKFVNITSNNITYHYNTGYESKKMSVVLNDTTVYVTGVKLNKTSVNPTVGDTVQLTATVSPSDATNKTVYWSSSNPSVATVDGAGKVTAKGAGTAKITVKTDDGSKTATCTITVKNKPVNVTGVKLNKTSVNATAGDAVQLTATVNPENATNKGVTWSSSNTVVATVDSNGKVVAKKAGTAKITVKTKDGGKTSACTVTVEAKKVAKKNGWYNEGGFRYYKDGVAYKGWHKMGKAEGEKTEHWSYFGKDGKIYTGWKKMGKAEGEKTEHWSYFGDNGWLRTGWQKMATKANPDGKNAQHWSYFGANGWLRTGWQKMATKANPDGKNAQHWSYFGNNGWLRTGWQKMATSSNPDGKNAQHWSYFGANGWLRIGMQNMATSYNPDGNNKQHRSYFGGNGWLVVNKKFSLSGKNYSADGKGWVTEVKKTSTGNAGTTKAAATSGTYILNLNSKVFHKSNCGSVTRMSASNKKSFNGTRAQAIAQGYTPCHNCNP